MKKILLCIPAFNGYENLLIEKLKNRDFRVELFNYSEEKYQKARKIKNPFLRLWNNIYLKRRGEDLKDKFEAKIINKDLLKMCKEYDYIIKIGMFFLDESTLKILRSKGKYLILHHWDVITKKYEAKFLQEEKYFDKISSYSKKDAEKYKINYLSNFYFSQKISNSSINNEVFTIMADFHGKLKRKQFLEKVAKDLQENNIKYEFILVDKKGEESSLIKVTKEVLSLEKVMEKYSESKVILEYVKVENEGCSTLRALDCLGLKKKLITNNKEIINEDYYNKNNIFIIDENNIDIPIEFINSPYEELPKELVEKYYIDNWLDELLKIN